jgi:hypothetical protein
MHEVDAVDQVRTLGTEQSLLFPCRQPLLGPAPDVEAETGALNMGSSKPSPVQATRANASKSPDGSVIMNIGV